MKPKRYPYSGEKKPIENSIDSLTRICRLESQVTSLANHEIFKIPSSRSSTVYPALMHSEMISSLGMEYSAGSIQQTLNDGSLRIV